MPLIQPTRRSFIRGAALLFAAPMIVRAANIMPVRALPAGWTIEYWIAEWDGRNRWRRVCLSFDPASGHEASAPLGASILDLAISMPGRGITVKADRGYTLGTGDTLRVMLPPVVLT